MSLTKENHTQVSNEFIEDYMCQLSGSAVKIFLVISRKTKGWHKDTDSISISQMQEISGLSNRQTISAVKELENMGLIRVDKCAGKISAYTINYTSEVITPVESSPVKKLHTPHAKSSPVKPETPAKTSHTKEIVKETITKEILITPAEAITLTQKLYDYIPKPTRWNKKPPDLTKWSEEIEKLHRIDGIDYELVDQVIEFIFKHDRWKWKEIILSAASLRKHFSTIESRIPKSMKQTSESMQDDVDYYNQRIKEIQNETR